MPPPLFGLFMQQTRLKPVRRLPIAIGRLTKRGDGATTRRLEPSLTQPAIRRDSVRSIAAQPRLLVETADALTGFLRPAPVVWAADGRVVLPEHGRRRAKRFASGEYLELEDSCTLIPLDQPRRLAHAIREFVRKRANNPYKPGVIEDAVS